MDILDHGSQDVQQLLKKVCEQFKCWVNQLCHIWQACLYLCVCLSVFAYVAVLLIIYTPSKYFSLQWEIYGSDPFAGANYSTDVTLHFVMVCFSHVKVTWNSIFIRIPQITNHWPTGIIRGMQQFCVLNKTSASSNEIREFGEELI